MPPWNVADGGLGQGADDGGNVWGAVAGGVGVDVAGGSQLPPGAL